MTEPTCPFCAEPVGPDEEKCRSCGERLDGESDVEVRSGSGATIAIILVVGFLLIAGLVCVVPFFMLRAAPVAPAPVPVPAPPLPNLPPDPGQASDAQIQALELTTGVTRPPSSGTHTVPTCLSGWGGYALIDIGNVRIAVRGVQGLPGVLGSRDMIVQTGPFTSSMSSSSTTAGGHTFSVDHRDGVTRCSFDALSFDVQDGQLTLQPSDTSVDVFGSTKVVIVDPDGGNPVVLPYTGP